MIYGYARVSTYGQAKDGNSLESQMELLKANGAEVIEVERFTGTRMQRPVFAELLKKLEPGDTLKITKIDRFARTVGQASELIGELIDRGITVHILNLGVLDNSSTSVLIRNIFLAFAQFERDMIVERTQEGKSIAKLDPSFKEGRPKKFAKVQVELALELIDKYSYKRVSEMTGISESTLYRAMRKKRRDDAKD